MNRLSSLVLLVFLLAEYAVQAQGLTGPNAGLNAAMTKLFGDITGFSARADVRLLDSKQKETMRVPMDFALLDGKVRAEVSLGEMKSAQMPAETLAQLKQMGMDRMITIVRPDLKSSLVVYPTLKAYAPNPMSNAELQEMADHYQVTKSILGKETIDGYQCEKCKVTVTGQRGEAREALAWYASELKGFPIQIQMTDKDSTVVMRYRDVKLAPPATTLFDAPADYTKHDNVQQLMQSAMMKRFNSGK
jgi:hypothetical protein